MEFDSTRFGTLQIDPATVLHFPRGLPGFEHCVRWKLLHEEGGGSQPLHMVYMLHSLDDPDIVLPVTDPVVFGFQYEFVLSDSEVAELQLDDPEDLVILAILSSSESAPPAVGGTVFQRMSAQISAPLVLNPKAQTGFQKILLGREAKILYYPPASTE
ncbi:MAG TPA: flagellar biosynthesis protein FliW [Betaproteobacteria bacterium]|nr:flagellar biosynthesis protein FliW [Betaproteobacteria bacterium]